MSQQAPYAYVTLAQARQQLANRLYDPQLFWSPPELNVIITEGLRTWNSLTSMWREDFLWQTVAGTTWYDLTSLANTIRPYTVTDATLYTQILFHLLEPPTGPVSLQYSTDDLVNAVARRRDEVLSTTSCTQTRITVPAVNGRITLADNIIDVRRMSYLPAYVPQGGYGSGYYGSGVYGISPFVNIQGYIVWPEDAWGEQSFNRLYLQQPPGKPFTYLMTTQPPLSFDTDRPPDSAGSYELLTVQAGGALSFPGGTTLNVPDDWTWVIKFGALADLFGREANAADPTRQVYCENRYKMGLQLLTNASALLQMRLNNVAMQVDAVRSGDLWNTTWQSQPIGRPKTCLYSGLNLIALAPTPDTQPTAGVPYDMTTTCVENAPVPVLDTDLIQLSRGDYDALLDYCVHLAMLKAGGKEFTDTMQLFERFLKQAALYGLKLSEIAEFTQPIYDLANLEKNMNPVLAPAPETT
jgi:hypothetical protein